MESNDFCILPDNSNTSSIIDNTESIESSIMDTSNFSKPSIKRVIFIYLFI